MAEANHPAIADQQIKAHGEDHINQNARDVRGEKRAVEQRDRHQHGSDYNRCDDGDGPHHAVFPNSPRGRQTSTAAINA